MIYIFWIFFYCLDVLTDLTCLPNSSSSIFKSCANDNLLDKKFPFFNEKENLIYLSSMHNKDLLESNTQSYISIRANKYSINKDSKLLNRVKQRRLSLLKIIKNYSVDMPSQNVTTTLLQPKKFSSGF